MFNFFRKNKVVRTCGVVDFIREYALNPRHSRIYRNRYFNIARKIALFESDAEMKILSNTFDFETAESFIYFLENLNLRRNTIKDIYEGVSYIFRLMNLRGYVVDFSFTGIKIEREDSTQVYLTNDELQRIYSLKFRLKNTEKVRDLFILACYTGLRYSDFSRIETSNYDGESIKIKTRKTGAIVHVPANSCVRAIMKKYDGRIEYCNTQSNFNLRLKTICKKAGINDKILSEYTQGRKIVKRVRRKWELVGSHTARRSFATNAYLACIPTARIMLMTGHKTEQSFFNYIRIQKSENAKALANHPFFN